MIYIKVLIAIACFIAGWLVNGWRVSSSVESLKAQYASEKEQVEKDARKREQAIVKAYGDLEAEYKKEKENAQTKIADLRKRIQSGTVRLSIPTNMSDDTGLADRKTRTELDGETADSLVAIAADGDAAIADLNLCIDKYNKIKKTLDK